MSFQKAYKKYTQLNNRPGNELKGNEGELIRRFEKNHPYLYQRRNGVVDLSTLGDKGLGYKNEDLSEDTHQGIFS